MFHILNMNIIYFKFSEKTILSHYEHFLVFVFRRNFKFLSS